MAANDTQKIKLPSSVVSTIIGKVKDTSTIATLSPSTPQKFADTTYHAINPKTGLGLTGYTALTADKDVHSVAKTDSPVDDIDSLSDALLDYGINGIAMSRQFASELRKLRVPATGQRLYPEVPLSLNVGNLDGIPASVSGTVNGRLAKTPTKVSAIMGDFSAIKWGMVRDITAEVIEYGDPDNTGQDLKGYNQIAYRTEAVLAYAVLDPKAFAVLKSA